MSLEKFKNRENLLSAEQMKRVSGGGTGTCGYKSSTGTVECNVSKVEALFMVEDGGHWCCESCHKSTYCG